MALGADGVEHEYHSMDDVPPEFRAEIEEANKAKGKQSSTTKTSKTDNTVTRDHDQKRCHNLQNRR
jgi:hypothetical protein